MVGQGLPVELEISQAIDSSPFLSKTSLNINTYIADNLELNEDFKRKCGKVMDNLADFLKTDHNMADWTVGQTIKVFKIIIVFLYFN